jgi:hypothetical protein
MIGGVSPGTCWALDKYGIIKFWYIIASWWIFLYELYHDARIHKHQAHVLHYMVLIADTALQTDRRSWSSLRGVYFSLHHKHLVSDNSIKLE